MRWWRAKAVSSLSLLESSNPAWVSPNAVVAVLSAGAEAALVYPVASCIGQLKWMAMREAETRRVFSVIPPSESRVRD